MEDYLSENTGQEIENAINKVVSGELVTQEQLTEAISNAITTTLNTAV